MANDEHVAKLKQGVEAWNAWRRENPDIRPELSGADLRDWDLRIVEPLLHRETHCLRAAASLTPHPSLDHCLLACLTCHTEDGSELALGLCICRAALTPPEFLDAFVNDSQERFEICRQEEEKIQVEMVPIHVQIPRDFAPLASRRTYLPRALVRAVRARRRAAVFRQISV